MQMNENTAFTHCLLRDVGSYSVEKYILKKKIKKRMRYDKSYYFYKQVSNFIWVGLQITFTPMVPMDKTNWAKFLKILLATLVFVFTEILRDLRGDPRGSNTAGFRNNWGRLFAIHFFSRGPLCTERWGQTGYPSPRYNIRACTRTTCQAQWIWFLILISFSCPRDCLDSVKCKTEPGWQSAVIYDTYFRWNY